MSWVRPDQKTLPDLSHTPANTQLYSGTDVVRQKLSRKCTYPPSLEPGTCCAQIHYAIPLAHSCFIRKKLVERL